jgi:SnoaL-like domain
MALQLPKPIAIYFAAEKADPETFTRCFAEDAVVKDEGHTYIGVAAIKRWRTEAQAKYVYTSEPFASAQKAGKTIITSRLTGNFPGSPIDLRYFFTLDGDKITSLEIIV